MSEVGVYSRYGLNKHRWVIQAFPELNVAIVWADTYEEASERARRLVQERIPLNTHHTWIHHPHTTDSETDDPIAWFGSWGAKWETELDDLLAG